MSARRGLTLLETMVALVILGLVSLASLELFGGTLRATENARQWSQAVAFAEDGMEQIKLDPHDPASRAAAVLPGAGGIERRVESQVWGDGLERVTVTVVLPGRGEFALTRLVEMR